METKQTEEQILKAAETLFLEQGFKETTTAQIAKAAGCNSALVHYYFRTKENLFAKIFETKVEEYAQSLFLELDQIESVDSLVRYAVEGHWRFMAQNATLVLFMLREILNMNERTTFFLEKHKEMRLRTTQRMEELRKKHHEAPEVCALGSEDLLTLIISLDASYFFPLAIKAKSTGEPIDEAEFIRQREEVIKTVIARLHYQV